MTNTGRKLMAAIVAALASVAILITLLAHYADHILVNSSSFANRAVSVVQTPGVESMIGLCINTIPVRIQFPPDRPVAEWLRGIQEQQSASRQRQQEKTSTGNGE